MEKVRQLLEKNLNENTLRAVVSNRRSKQVSQKLVFRPFMEMCIRDRCFAEILKRNLLFFKVCKAIIHQRPVSYTHLDVYKRQNIHCGLSDKQKKIDFIERKIIDCNGQKMENRKESV